MTIKYRTSGAWGSGEGRGLYAAEVDENFYDHEGRIETLETNPSDANSIANVTIAGNVITVTLDDGTTFAGTLTVPLMRFRGEYDASATYAVYDAFTYGGAALYWTLIGISAPGAFDPALAESDGSAYWQKIVDLVEPPATISMTTHTLAFADLGKYNRCTNSAGCTINIPSGMWPVGAVASFRQTAAGPIVITHDSAVTVNALEGHDLATVLQGSTITLKNVDGADEWDFIGIAQAASA